jgi:hypothetical protein
MWFLMVDGCSLGVKMLANVDIVLDTSSQWENHPSLLP